VYPLGSANTSLFWQVREIYETAIQAEPPHNLSDEDCKRMCLRYAALERKLGEIDRARAIFVHASSLADPRVDVLFWTQWNDFEVAHGNEDTFRCVPPFVSPFLPSFFPFLSAPSSGRPLCGCSLLDALG
jgi:hypothetical protein